MNSKRKIVFNIPYFTKLFLSKIVLILLCINFSEAQIRVSNPCTIDYNSIINSASGGGMGGGGNGSNPSNQQPPDPTNIYYSSTSFIDEDPSSTGGSWNFGDGSPLVLGKVVQHQYATVGTYTVTLNVPGKPIQTKTVTINYAPKAPYFLDSYAKRDTSLCADFRLDPYKSFAPSGVSYLWYPDASTSPTLLATKSDLYSVKVTDNTTGCSITASISVIICGTPNPPLQSIAEYHFGNGIKRLANHGNAAFATVYPIGEDYQNSGVLNSNTAASSVSNPNPFHYQRYMFTTDGSTLFGNQGQIIARDISGNGKKAKQTLIVPKIEADTVVTTQYYILTVNEDGVLSYTLIDGIGKLEGDASIVEYNVGGTIFQEKNVQLLTNMNGKIVSSKYFRGPNFVGYYVVVAGNDGFYYTFKISKLGIEGPIKSAGVGAGKNEIGQLKFSDDGRKLISAISAPPFNQIQVCNFDSTSGNISGCNLLNLGNGPAKLYGLEFSPDGNFIYYTLNGASGGTSEFRRFDIANNKSMLIQKAENGEEFGALEGYKVPGYQTEIVMAINGEKFIASLERPNALIEDLYLSNDADTTVAYRQDRLKFTLKGHRFVFAKSTLGLNNAVDLPENSSPSSDAMQFEPDCVDESIKFQATPKCDVDPMTIKYEWDFGDGSQTGSGQQASHTYDKPGLYNIKLYITYCGKPPVVVEDVLIVIPKPFTDLKPEYENCFKILKDFPIPVKITNLRELDINYASQLEFEWTGAGIVSGSTANRILVNEPTSLDLKVNYIYPLSKTTSKTCSNTFKTIVKEFCPPVFAVPDVFSPNGDSVNDALDMIKDEIDSNNYKFRIYNRWGELVYFSETVAEPNPWNGKFHGKDCEPDSFAWTVEYRSRFRPNGITYKNQGAFVLVR
ncbi:MAG: PKD domain-containing protein [Bacteroidota bacterium]